MTNRCPVEGCCDRVCPGLRWCVERVRPEHALDLRVSHSLSVGTKSRQDMFFPPTAVRCPKLACSAERGRDGEE